MAADHFFKRWARPNMDGSEPPLVVAPAAEPVPTAGQPARPPTLVDVTGLTANSDYSRFLAAGVDKAVQRAALKKLFCDPHFNLLDGLDIYMGDYSQASPMPAAMLAALHHVQGLLEPTPSELDPLPQPITPPLPATSSPDNAGQRKGDS